MADYAVSPSRTYVVTYGIHSKILPEQRQQYQAELPENLVNNAAIASAYARKKLPHGSYIFGAKPIEAVGVAKTKGMTMSQASKAAKELAETRNVILSEVAGTGKDDLITVGDVRSYLIDQAKLKGLEEEEDEQDEEDAGPDKGVVRGGLDVLK